MNIYLKNITVALLVYLFCVLATINLSFAYQTCSILVPQNGGDSQELTLDYYVGRDVATCANAAGMPLWFWYGSQVTTNAIYTAATGMDPYAAASSALYIGEGGSMWQWNGAYWDKQYAISNNPNPSVPIQDQSIYPYSSNGNVKFVFLWACEQGYERGSGSRFSGVPFGMPFCWLHNSSMSSNGYTNPDGSGKAFIGFTAGAPWLELPFFGGNLSDFIREFYFFAFCCGNTYHVHWALDSASTLTLGMPFSQSHLYNGFWYTYWDYIHKQMVNETTYMKVYGDSTLHLCNTNPSFAMKTGVNGYFYNPNQMVSYLKVEKWFTNTSAVGDQTGAGSFYTFGVPDGKVNLADLTALNNAYGAHEGYPNWNYQVDIIPDRYIGLTDLVALNNNYGRTSTSWYSTNLTGISVVLSLTNNTTQTVYPDYYGFVEIPFNLTRIVTSWTVKWQNAPVGAFLTFWR